MTEDFIGHLITSVIAGLASLVALYVSYRLSQQREWFRVEMTKVVKENCAGKVEFEAHARADDHFQQTIIADMSEKRAEYGRKHADHYAHAANAVIHQPSMSSELLQEKFSNVREQLKVVHERVDRIVTILEKAGP